MPYWQPGVKVPKMGYLYPKADRRVHAPAICFAFSGVPHPYQVVRDAPFADTRAALP